MNLRTSVLERPSGLLARGRGEIDMNGLHCVPAPSGLQVMARNRAPERKLESPVEAPKRPVPAPKEVRVEDARPTLVTRALSWLRGEVPAPKRLRLAEAVSLGEKRFVAIIHAEGHKYLVGGGSSGVVLLTELNEPAKPRNLESFAELIEAAG